MRAIDNRFYIAVVDLIAAIENLNPGRYTPLGTLAEGLSRAVLLYEYETGIAQSLPPEDDENDD